ncbi:MAG: Ig-like domain-containing protein, partial [Clostridia bacterium]|nr:Ig-like domain-containing protein [Clostridia bacterium]
MNAVKRLGALLLTICLLLTMVPAITVAAVSNTENGLDFSSDMPYQAASTAWTLPTTLEATVYFPQGTTAATRGGVIMGNYASAPKDGATNAFSFEIHTNGNVRLYIIDSTGAVHDFKFTGTNVYNGQNNHIAVVRDVTNSRLHCYINGTLEQSLTYNGPASLSFTSKMRIGSDLRVAKSVQNFKGYIKNITLYSDVRTATEVAADATAAKVDTDALLANYDLSAAAEGSRPDSLVCTEGIGPTFTGYFQTQEKPLDDYAYSFAVLGDIQTMTVQWPNTVPMVYDWILENQEERKIEFVVGLGDMVDSYTVRSEWELVKTQISRMNGKIPYSFVRGNHDDLALFKEYFTQADFGSAISGSYDNTMMNTFQKIEICGNNYIIMNLDITATDDVLAWAGEVADANPDHTVIVTTHIYMLATGAYNDLKKYSAPNSATDWWNEFISQHKNISMVLCGHSPTDKIVTRSDVGVNGNTVHQMLIDPQGTDENWNNGAALIAMLYFSEDGKDVQVRYYSVTRDAYFLPVNQFDFSLETPTATALPNSERVKSIEVTTLPNKVVYAEGEALNKAGMVVTATYGDNSQKAVTDFRVTGYDAAVPGEQTVTVTYRDARTSFTVTVEHVYESECDEICNVCKAKRTVTATHTYSGDCDVACNVCKTQRSTTTAHDYQGGTNCTVCGFEKPTGPDPNDPNNIIINGDFEQGPSVAWGNSTRVQEGAGKNDSWGLVSVRGEGNDDDWDSGNGAYYKEALLGKLKPNTTYVFSFDYKNVGEGRPKLYLGKTWGTTAEGVELKAGSAYHLPDGETDWTTYSITFTTPASISKSPGYEIKFESRGKPGTTYYDNVILMEKTEPTLDAIVLNNTTLELNEGATATLTATPQPSDAALPAITWNSSDKTVATVDANGKITAIKGGTTTITATVGDLSASCTVTVNHTYDNDCDAECNVCHEGRTVTHDFDWVIDDAGNCGVDGKKHEECSVCHEKRNENTPIPASGDHTYSNGWDTDCNVCEAEREITYSGWALDGGKWYFYNNGTMVKNAWRKDSVGWVFLGKDGAMLTNAWCTDSQGWCYVGANGYAVT